jgi:DNA-binding XRE family transcriptional regulator
MPKSYEILSREDVVRNQRVLKGWSATRLAALVGISRQTLSMIEHGGSTSETTARKIAELFNLSVDQMFKIVNKNGSGSG